MGICESSKDYQPNGKNIINCILDIKLNEIKDGITLFNQHENNIDPIKDSIYVFLENKRINIINEDYKWKLDYIFQKDGFYNIKIIFKNDLNNLKRLFEYCSFLYLIDLSNFNTSYATDMGFMFNQCHKLKAIKGLNNFNTNQVIKMNSMFQSCKELEYLDLSSFNTSNVTDMGWMFNECHKLKVIKGLNNFNTSQVIKMCSMF